MVKQKKLMSVWVLTREHNDQQGKYFEALFLAKPTRQELAEHFENNDRPPEWNDIMAAVAFLNNLLEGGGRRDLEDVWYNLEEIPV